MNKKGFIKIMEAIIAIVILLAFVIAILPQNKVDRAAVPPDLELTMISVLKEMQGNSNFRNCILGQDLNFEEATGENYGTSRGSECAYTYIVNFTARPFSAHPWNYAVKICESNETTSPIDCNYYPNSEITSEIEFNQIILPSNKDIYTRAITITVPDVTGQDYIITTGNFTVLTIFAWSKD